MRLTMEEHRGVFYDWYHTTGSVVKNTRGYAERIGTYLDAEELGNFINKDITTK